MFTYEREVYSLILERGKEPETSISCGLFKRSHAAHNEIPDYTTRSHAILNGLTLQTSKYTRLLHTRPNSRLIAFSGHNKSTG